MAIKWVMGALEMEDEESAALTENAVQLKMKKKNMRKKGYLLRERDLWPYSVLTRRIYNKCHQWRLRISMWVFQF